MSILCFRAQCKVNFVARNRTARSSQRGRVARAAELGSKVMVSVYQRLFFRLLPLSVKFRHLLLLFVLFVVLFMFGARLKLAPPEDVSARLPIRAPRLHAPRSPRQDLFVVVCRYQSLYVFCLTPRQDICAALFAFRLRSSPQSKPRTPGS